MSSARETKSKETSNSDTSSTGLGMQTTVEAILIFVVIVLVFYAVIVDFNLWCLIGASIIACLVYAGLRKQLKAFAEHDNSHWTAVGLLIVFVSSFEFTKNDNGIYHALAAMVLVCVISFFVKTVIFGLVSVFLFSYLACSLLAKHFERTFNGHNGSRFSSSTSESGN